MKFTLIGTGFIMPRHAEAIYNLGGKIIDTVNTAYGEETWRKAATNPKTDYVIVLGPNDLHYEISLAAAQAGKTVLCEKPLALTAAHIKDLSNYKNIFTVLQLRHHPMAKELRASISPDKQYDIEMDISVYRDPKYYETWKGQAARSGGVLFNLGIHYFDMLLYLFGAPINYNVTSINDKTGTGEIRGKNWLCKFHVSTDERRDNQRRVFKINGKDYNFSSQDNLSFENLHRHVYADLMQGKGIAPMDALPSTQLVESLTHAEAGKEYKVTFS